MGSTTLSFKGALAVGWTTDGLDVVLWGAGFLGSDFTGEDDFVGETLLGLEGVGTAPVVGAVVGAF